MDLPVMPPIKPMLAKARDTVPDQPVVPDKPDDSAASGRWRYEPKWDGFRCLVFRDGDEIELTSRNTRPLTRYFPEVVEAIRAELPERCVVDGELMVPRRSDDGTGRLDWDALSQRIHPAASRVAKLSEETPAIFVAFDLLALDDEDLTSQPFSRRRELLETRVVGGGPGCHVTRTTEDPALAQQWFERFEGAGLDGVVAKPLDGPYVPDARSMVKIKHKRTADCVVVGYRPHKSLPGIGSMLLGLYRDGELRNIGGASAFTAVRRKELLEELAPYRLGEDVTAQGEANRWNAREDHSWVPLRPELVVEVAYDQMEGDRLRHAARFLRWRPDRDPESCRYDQLDAPAAYDLGDVLR